MHALIDFKVSKSDITGLLIRFYHYSPFRKVDLIMKMTYDLLQKFIYTDTYVLIIRMHVRYVHGTYSRGSKEKNSSVRMHREFDINRERKSKRPINIRM